MTHKIPDDGEQPAARIVALLGIWTVYDHPVDYPEGFIARLHQVTARGPVATEHTVKAPTLGEVRARLPAGLARLARDPNDDPKIVENWI